MVLRKGSGRVLGREVPVGKGLGFCWQGVVGFQWWVLLGHEELCYGGSSDGLVR